MTRVSSTPPRAPRRSPTSTATPASCATAATRSTSWPRGLVPRGVLPAHLRRAADRGPAGRVHRQAQRAHAAARGPAALLRRVPARRAPDAGAVLGGQRAVHVLPGQPRPVRPEQVEISTVRLLAKLPTIASYAYKKSIGQPLLYPDNNLGLRGELPADDVRGAGDRVRGRPGGGQGAGPAVRAARRPRAELLDLGRTAGRFGPRQPVRLGLGRHRARCPARCTAAPTRRCCRCSATSRPTAATWTRSSAG